MSSPSDEPAFLRTRRWVLPFLLCVHVMVMISWICSTRGPHVINPFFGWIAGGLILSVVAVVLTRLASYGSKRSAPLWILVISVLLHAAVLALHWPLLSDDVVRYRFDGRQWLAGRNAYGVTPLEIQQAGKADAIDRLTPHASTSAIYLPTSQIYFAGVSALEHLAMEPQTTMQREWRAAQPELSWIERAAVWRIASSLLTLLCTALLLRILHQLGRSAWWATMFAWHPLTLLESAGSAHQDVLGIALMLGAVTLALANRHTSSVLATCFAVFVKPIAAIPALAQLDLRRRVSVRDAAFLLIFCSAGALLTYALGGNAILDAMHRYGTTWEFNGGAFEIFKWLAIEQLGFEPNAMKQHLRKVGGAIVLLVALVLWLRKFDAFSISAWVMAISCLVSPVLYPWYLLWPLALVATGTPAARWTLLTWSATSVLSYQVLREPEWILPAHILWLEYAPVIIALAVDIIFATRARKSGDA